MILVANIFLLLSCVAFAEPDFSYFSDPVIRYWDKPESPLQVVPRPGIATPEPAKFPWHKYLDPKNDEFFKEGDYSPPAPFVEIARNPTDENIKNWFQYLALKNGLAERLQAKLEEFARTQAGQGVRLLTQAASRVGAMAATNSNSKDYRLRLYFDSRCQHCEHMMETLATLSRQGFYVELRRVDAVPGFQPRFPFPVEQATQEELQKNQVEAVPVLLVGDLKNQTIFKIQGFQTPEAVLAAMREVKANSLNNSPSMSKGGQS